MRFSIVIPVYNVEEYVAECIESVLSQTYHDFEIILVDDGSTDSSGMICDCYAQSHMDKVKVIHTPNHGQNKARIAGVQRACGDICMFIDADDYIHAEALALLDQGFRETSCDMILFNASRELGFCKPFQTLPFDDGQCFFDRGKEAVYYLMTSSSALNALWLKAMRIEIARTGLSTYSDFYGRNGEDLLLSLPMVTYADKIVYLDKILYYYRPRQGSTVRTYNPGRHRSIKTVHQEMEKYIDIWGLQELHSRHYTREVRGWVECLKQLMRNAAGNEAAQLLQELAEDDYFRNAYQKMEAEELSRRDALLAKWLYERKYRWLMLMGGIVRPMDKLRNCLKIK